MMTRQFGADDPFQDIEAMKWFNFYGGLMYGWRFKKARLNTKTQRHKDTKKAGIE
jgi:hypothetical protein